MLTNIAKMTSQRDLAISQESRQLQGIQKSLLENAKSEDGSTDKLVALLTIVFVPSTFVAVRPSTLTQGDIQRLMVVTGNNHDANF